jgi:hypothetical protein
MSVLANELPDLKSDINHYKQDKLCAASGYSHCPETYQSIGFEQSIYNFVNLVTLRMELLTNASIATSFNNSESKFLGIEAFHPLTALVFWTLASNDIMKYYNDRILTFGTGL